MKKLTQVLSAALLTLASSQVFADAIADAVGSDFRSNENRLRDEYRHPQQTLRFFGVKPTDTVVEIWPGGGWYADILAPLLKDNGKYIAAHFLVDENTSDYYRNSLNTFKDKVANLAPYSKTQITAFHPVNSLDFAPAGSADVVLTFRNIHNWYMRHEKAGVEDTFKAFYKALKPGGVLGVVEHQLPESEPDEAMKKSGYMKKSFVIAAAKAAGFELAAESDVNHNALDTADYERGVWTLPPTLTLKDVDRDHYLAIGESNRMTLKFVKPD